jgi:hypothetical protein
MVEDADVLLTRVTRKLVIRLRFFVGPTMNDLPKDVIEVAAKQGYAGIKGTLKDGHMYTWSKKWMTGRTSK